VAQPINDYDRDLGHLVRKHQGDIRAAAKDALHANLKDRVQRNNTDLYGFVHRVLPTLAMVRDQ
jgi:hypothetical protein